MVQKYQRRINEAGLDDQKKELALLELADFCRQGVQELIEKGHKDLLILGKPSLEGRWQQFAGPLHYYHMVDGNLYVGFPTLTFFPERWTRREIQLHDIPFGTYKADDLVKIATQLEKAIENQ